MRNAHSTRTESITRPCHCGLTYSSFRLLPALASGREGGGEIRVVSETYISRARVYARARVGATSRPSGETVKSAGTAAEGRRGI